MLSRVAHRLLLFTRSIAGSCDTLLRFVYPTSRVSACSKTDPDRKYHSNLENSVLYFFTSLQAFILPFWLQRTEISQEQVIGWQLNILHKCQVIK